MSVWIRQNGGDVLLTILGTTEVNVQLSRALCQKLGRWERYLANAMKVR